MPLLTGSRSNYATTQDLANLAHRVDALEAALVKSGAIVPSDLEQFLKQIQSKLPPPGSGGQNPAMGNPQDADDVSDTEGAALTLEHLAFGRARVDGAHSIPHFNGISRKVSSVSKQAPGHGYHLARQTQQTGDSPSMFSPSNVKSEFRFLGNTEERGARISALAEQLSPVEVFDMYTRKTDLVLNALTRCLPSRERGELMVNAYLNRVDWLHRCELRQLEPQLTSSIPRPDLPQPVPRPLGSAA